MSFINKGIVNVYFAVGFTFFFFLLLKKLIMSIWFYYNIKGAEFISLQVNTQGRMCSDFYWDASIVNSGMTNVISRQQCGDSSLVIKKGCFPPAALPSDVHKMFIYWAYKYFFFLLKREFLRRIAYSSCIGVSRYRVEETSFNFTPCWFLSSNIGL